MLTARCTLEWIKPMLPTLRKVAASRFTTRCCDLDQRWRKKLDEVRTPLVDGRMARIRPKWPILREYALSGRELSFESTALYSAQLINDNRITESRFWTGGPWPGAR